MLINNRHQASVIKTPHDSQIRPLVDRTNSPITKCSLAEEVLPPGASVGAHHHETTEEIYYILSGTGVMTIGDERRAVGAGDAIFIPIGSVHTLTNTGDVAMTLLLVCGPAYSRDDHLMREG